MTRRLVLLTNQFPFNFGDYAFVRHEIDALAASFDEVIVFNYSSEGSPDLVPLPSNVRYGGNLFGMAAKDILGALVLPRNMVVLARAAFAEAREGQLAGNVVRFLKSALTGMRIAADARLHQAVTVPDTQTFVYSFWGMGAGLSLPWLPDHVSRISVRLHRYDLYKDQGINGYLPFRAALFAKVDTIMPISEAGRTYLLESHPTLELDRKVVVSRLGSGEPFEAKPISQPKAEACATAAGGYLVVSCSNLIAVKRVDRLLRALTDLDCPKPLRWIHFGGGPLEAELRALATRMARDGLSVEFAGATPNDEVQEFYARHDVSLFVNVSSSEGIPVSIMEAISYDIPVLATDVGGTKEIVGADLGTGMLLDPNFSDTELTTALQHMLETPAGFYAPKATWRRLYSATANSRAAAQTVAGPRS